MGFLWMVWLGRISRVAGVEGSFWTWWASGSILSSFNTIWQRRCVSGGAGSQQEFTSRGQNWPLLFSNTLNKTTSTFWLLLVATIYKSMDVEIPNVVKVSSCAATIKKEFVIPPSMICFTPITIRLGTNTAPADTVIPNDGTEGHCSQIDFQLPLQGNCSLRVTSVELSTSNLHSYHMSKAYDATWRLQTEIFYLVNFPVHSISNSLLIQLL